MKLFQSGKYSKDDLTAIIRQKYGVPALTSDDVQAISEAMDKWSAESDPKLKDGYVNQAASIIAGRMRTTLLDKADNWRFMSMLLNFKTHLRNIFGNAAADVMRRTKNVVGILPEKALPVEQRTKAIVTGADKVLKDFAEKDYSNVEGMLRQESKLDFENVIQKNRKIFNTGFLETARKFGFNMLDKEDLFSLKQSYTDSLAQVIKARKLTPQFLMSENGAKALESAREWATQEAMRSTFHENSQLAGKLNQLESKNATWRVALGGLMPFKKTPINILKQGARYSPLGLMKGLTYDIRELTHGNISGAQFIDNLSMGLTGTGIATVGGWLMSKGLITTSSDAKGKEYYNDQQQGYQDYALKIGNKTYTIDWITPSCIPFFLGAEMYKSFSGNENETAAEKATQGFGRFMNAMTKVTDPLMNLSMLQGVNSAINSAASGTNGLWSMLQSSAQGYAGQYIPTALGQLARTVTPYQKSTTAASNSPLFKPIEQTGRQMMAKVPGLNLLLPNKTDMWGNPATTGNLATRAFQNLISPGYLAVSKQTPIDKEVNRLYQATGTTSVLPGTLTSNSYVKTSSGNLYMTPEEKSEFQQTYGRVAAQGIKDLISDSSYTSADDTDPSTLTSYQKGKNPDKKTMVEKVYDAAKNQATAQFLHSRYNKLLSSNKDKFYNSLTAAQKTLFDNYQGG